MKRIQAAALALSFSLLGFPAPGAPAASSLEALRNAARPAAGDSEAVILTMERALSIALDRNFTVLTAEQNVESAKGQSKAAGAALNPQLNLQGQGNAYDNIPGYPDNELLSRVTVGQSLYSGGKNQARARQGKLGVEQAEQDLRSARESVALTVWNAYCEVLYRREVLRNTGNALDYYTNAEKELKERVAYGLSTNLDLTRVRQQKENARASNIAAGNNLEAARIELCRLLRMRPETNLALSGSLEDNLPKLEDTRKIPDDVEAAVREVLERRGDYQSLRCAAASRKNEIAVAKSGMLPTLSLSGGYCFGYTSNGLGGVSDKNQWTASLTLDVPVYDGGSTSGNVRAAKAGLKAAEHALGEKEDSIKAELADSWLSLQNALETLNAGRANLQLAQESLAYAESGYREGVNTQIDVLQARSELTDALQLLAQYLRDSREAQAGLWKAQGLLIERALLQENLRDRAAAPAKSAGLRADSRKKTK
ncbi:MAG: TolC family protein [Pyramidobacter sp.]|uniref:TolC family protein n=2 Tax=Pyramidobacter TaxID=638847 RepID=UPI002A8186EF|nr:TolC family protein [Pyramidobacter sp.]MDY4032826.1 TolC family protein [Pyramidobacter sp.]